MFAVVEDYLPGTARGCCYLCAAARRTLDTPEGGYRDELLVDTGVDIDFEGRLAICECCLRELGRLVGLVDEAAVTAAEERMLVMALALAEATERADAADAAVEANFAYLAQRDAHVQEAAPA